MGLAAPRKRRKIGVDPNNTAWTRSGSSYGQRIMSAQGWTPGSYLGAKDATHAAHFSAANAAPIRIAPKDDNLGVGAGNAAVENSNFGLRSLHDLYGRLNGKSEDTRRIEQSHMANLNLRLYADNKWGGLNFVQGGLLVGDKILNGLPESPSPSPAANLENGPVQDEPGRQSINGEKRQGGDHTVAADNDFSDNSSGCNRRDNNMDTSEEQSASKKKARRKLRKVSSAEHSDADHIHVDGNPLSKEVTTEQRKQRKEQKRQAREEKRSRRRSKLQKDEAAEEWGSSAADPSEESAAGGRYAVRQRFIKQKRMSSMDPQALREILMIKS